MSLKKLLGIFFFISSRLRTFQSLPELYVSLQQDFRLCKNWYISLLLHCSSTVLCISKTQGVTNLTSKHLLGYAGKKRAKCEKINKSFACRQDCGRGFEKKIQMSLRIPETVGLALSPSSAHSSQQIRCAIFNKPVGTVQQPWVLTTVLSSSVLLQIFFPECVVSSPNVPFCSVTSMLG